MTVGERIRALCIAHGTTIGTLEKELGYGNGSLITSTDKIQSNRAMEIANYFGVSINYILTGKDIPYLEEQGAEDFALLKKIHSLNTANYQLLINMIDTMLENQKS